MRRSTVLILLILLSLPGLARAQTAPLDTDPPALAITGTLEHGVFAASLRLMPAQTLTGIRLLVTDMADATGDAVLRYEQGEQALSKQ